MTDINSKLAAAEAIHMEQDGGALRLSSSPAASKLSQEDLERAMTGKRTPQPELRMPSGSVRMVYDRDGNGTLEHGRAYRITSSDLSNGLGGVLGTARSFSGRPLGVAELQPSTLVEVGGTQMTLRTAETLGLVTRNPNSGMYSEGLSPASITPPQQPQAPSLAPQPAPVEASAEEPAQTFADPEAEHDYRLMSLAVSEPLQSAAAQEMETSGEISQATVDRMAREVGTTAANISARLSGIMKALSVQGRSYVEGMGVDPAAFAAWAERNAGAAFKAAQKTHYQTRSPSKAYGALVGLYMSAARRG